jgi:hypothetical protein
MESDEQTSPYPYLISVRGGRPIAARRDGSYYVCAYETQFGLWWAARDVRVLEHDPHRDFYREQRQAYLAAHPENTTAPVTPAQDAATSGAATPVPDDTPSDPPGWERVDTLPSDCPSPPATPKPAAPRHAWGP